MNLYKSPEPVQEAMASEEVSGPIPIAAVFDAQIENQLGLVPYFHMKDVNGFTDVKAALAAMRGESPDATPAREYESETWKNTRGRKIQATYVTSSSEDVTLRLTNGKSSTVPLSSLSEASQKRIAQLAKE
tara:strand:- start:848 stop:1240 length:393 start_codon:yes stop_codon:yes gene_type:complete